ncbi:hypothetical protein D3C72_288080 [compost metagenome]
MPGPTDRRSPEAIAYRRLYKTAMWRSRRMHQLADEPLCRTCKAAGRITNATIADHIIPHRGDERLFFEGELQSLCDQEPWRCHSKIKQRAERLGYSPAVGADGFPLDPMHRANRPDLSSR